jgi:hypothetical protein
VRINLVLYTPRKYFLGKKREITDRLYYDYRERAAVQAGASYFGSAGIIYYTQGGKDATVFAIGGYGSTRSTETPARASP